MAEETKKAPPPPEPEPAPPVRMPMGREPSEVQTLRRKDKDD